MIGIQVFRSQYFSACYYGGKVFGKVFVVDKDCNNLRGFVIQAALVLLLLRRMQAEGLLLKSFPHDYILTQLVIYPPP